MYIHTYIHTYMHTYIHIEREVCVHMYIYIYIHIYVYRIFRESLILTLILARIRRQCQYRATEFSGKTPYREMRGSAGREKPFEPPIYIYIYIYTVLLALSLSEATANVGDPRGSYERPESLHVTYKYNIIIQHLYYIHTCLYNRIHMYIQIYTTKLYTYIFIQQNIYIYIYTHTHTYTHICFVSPKARAYNHGERVPRQ